MRELCQYCGGEADPFTTCPRAIECPTCHARPGSPCKRPSGHQAMRLHADRIALAEATPVETADLTVQLDIFGAEHLLAPEPAAPRVVSAEQPRLFEPQYEGQLDMSGDNPEERTGQ